MTTADCRCAQSAICNLQSAILLRGRAGGPRGQPGIEIDILANRLAAAVGVAIRLVGTGRAFPPVVAHVEGDLAGRAAPDPVLEVDRNNWRRVLLAGVVAHVQR